MLSKPTLILFHKQSTSGRLRFLCLPTGILCFDGLPEGAQNRSEPGSPIPVSGSHWLRIAEHQLGLADQSIQEVPDFEQWLDTPSGDVPILLAGFSDIDPPFAAAEKLGGKFIPILESRQLSPVEQNLLRLAYEHLLG
jgi:hypothetical protein